MTGFVYEKDNVVKYYTNAVAERTYEKRKELMCNGERVTPVFKKEYFFNSFGELPKCLEAFDKEIRARMDSNYLELINDLYAIKPEIDSDDLNALENNCQLGNFKGELQTLNYYKVMWHLV